MGYWSVNKAMRSASVLEHVSDQTFLKTEGQTGSSLAECCSLQNSKAVAQGARDETHSIIFI